MNQATARGFCGVEHLSMDAAGWVGWKGVEVDHFAYLSEAIQIEAAFRLEQRCWSLEERGFRPDRYTVAKFDDLAGLTAQTPCVDLPIYTDPLVSNQGELGVLTRDAGDFVFLIWRGAWVEGARDEQRHHVMVTARKEGFSTPELGQGISPPLLMTPPPCPAVSTVRAQWLQMF